jgi:hypothetical protein
MLTFERTDWGEPPEEDSDSESDLQEESSDEILDEEEESLNIQDANAEQEIECDFEYVIFFILTRIFSTE